MCTTSSSLKKLLRSSIAASRARLLLAYLLDMSRRAHGSIKPGGSLHSSCSLRFLQQTFWRVRTGHCATQSGVTLIELVMFILVVGVGVAGILLVYTNTVRYSADPVIRKQMLAVAEAMLEESALMPFTYCDPDDADAATAAAALVGAGNCASTVETIGPEVGLSLIHI